LVGEINDRIVATGAFRPVQGIIANFLDTIGDSTVEIKRMHVDPDYQRRGYGQQIFTELQQRAQNQEYTELVLLTTSPQIAAQNFYEGNGFEEIERESVEFQGESFDAIVYRKILTAPLTG
jgi:ribosomal protein S18 acetylase RimI-like enzyme